MKMGDGEWARYRHKWMLKKVAGKRYKAHTHPLIWRKKERKDQLYNTHSISLSFKHEARTLYIAYSRQWDRITVIFSMPSSHTQQQQQVTNDDDENFFVNRIELNEMKKRERKRQKEEKEVEKSWATAAVAMDESFASVFILLSQKNCETWKFFPCDIFGAR